MLMENERIQIVEYGKRLFTSGLTRGTGGNLSVFNREKGYFGITPSGMEYMSLTPEDIVIIDINGNIVDGKRKPSSEIEMHRIFYANRSDIDAIIHSHTMFSTAVSCMRRDLKPVHYMIALAGKDVKCAEYATFGTAELAINAFNAMEKRKAVLLPNHGILTGAQNLETAFDILEEVEYVAELHCRTYAMGEPVILDDQEMSIILEKFKVYGQKVLK
ncbi:L-fuculose phosphate aldolase [compost metagenome]